MKRILLTLFLLGTLGIVSVRAEELAITWSNEGYTNAQKITTVDKAPVTLVFSKGSGSNDPAYYTSGTNLRLYANNTLTISLQEGYELDEVSFTVTSNYNFTTSGTTATTMTSGTLSASGTTASWKADSSNPVSTVTLTNKASTQVRLTATTIKYHAATTRETVEISFAETECEATFENKTFASPALNGVPEGAVVTYKSSDEKIATVAADGTVTLLDTGVVTITATSAATADYTSATASYTLTITSSMHEPEMKFSAESITLNLGEALPELPALTFGEGVDASALSITYTSSNPEVVAVDATTGALTPLKKGTAVITAACAETETYHSDEASYTVIVVDPNAIPYTLINQPSQLYHGALGVLAVGNEGKAMGTKFVSGNTPYFEAAAVEVANKAIDDVSDDVAILRFDKVEGGYTVYLTNGETPGYLYNGGSSNGISVQKDPATAVVTFSDNNALITYGTRSIQKNSSLDRFTAYQNGTKAQLYLLPDTRKAIEGFGFEKEAGEVMANSTFTNTLAGVPEGVSVTYTTSDAAVATVDADGIVTAIKPGKVTITASTVPNYTYLPATASYELTVTRKLYAVEGLEVHPDVCEVEDDNYMEFVSPDDFLTGITNLTITSSDENVFLVMPVEVDGVQKWDYLAGSEPGTSEITLKWDAGTKYLAGEYTYTLTVTDRGELEAPKFRRPSGSELPYGTTVTITGPDDCDIYYGFGTSKEDAQTEYTGPFALTTMGEVTIVTYAIDWEHERESEATVVTFTVVPAAPVFGYFDEHDHALEAYTATMGDTEFPVLTNPLGREVVLTSSNTDVVRIAPDGSNHILMLMPGTATITATAAADDNYLAATAAYTLTVKKELGTAEQKSVTYDFVNETYGLTRTDGSGKYVTTATNLDVNGDVLATIANVSGNGWKLMAGGLRPYGTVTMTFAGTDPDIIITSVNFISGSDHISSYAVNDGDNVSLSSSTNFTVPCNAATAKIKMVTSANKDFTKIVVNYTLPSLETAHCSAGVAFEGDREALLDDMTEIAGATYSPDATPMLNYVVFDADGNVADDVIVEESENEGMLTVYADLRGDYTLAAYLDPYVEGNEKYYAAYAEAPLYVRSMITPATLYVHGHFYDRYFDLSRPVEMTKNGRVFTATDIYLGGNEDHADDPIHYVFATHALAAPVSARHRAASAENEHQWSQLTEGHAFDANGATPLADINSADDLTPFEAEKPGFYSLSADFTDPENPVMDAEFTGTTTGVEGIAVESAEATYYDLTGKRIERPEAGIVIRVCGGKAEKIVIK